MYSTFDQCYNLENVIVKATDRFYYENYLLMDNQKTSIVFFISASPITTLTLPETIETIKDQTFYASNNLIEIIVPGTNLVSIGIQAFKDCKNLVSLSLPSSLTSIGRDAFIGCDQLHCGCVHIPLNMVETAINVGSMKKSAVSSYCFDRKCVYSYQITPQPNNAFYRFYRRIFM